MKVPKVTYRPIAEWPMYRVGIDGSVWSRQMAMRRGECDLWKRLHPDIGTNGYYGVTLCRAGKKQRLSVHRIVLAAFVKAHPGANMEARHIDGNRLNNCCDNLKWGSKGENGADKVLHGTSLKGTMNPRARLKEQDVKTIRELASRGVSVRVLRECFCVSDASVRRIVARLSWRHID